MIGILDSKEIDNLLRSQIMGRIACSWEGNTYVVPISYAYDGEFIYCHTEEGKKMNMMRHNSKVCFEVDDLKNMANWRSVVIEGVFEEEDRMNFDSIDHLNNQ